MCEQAPAIGRCGRTPTKRVCQRPDISPANQGTIASTSCRRCQFVGGRVAAKNATTWGQESARAAEPASGGSRAGETPGVDNHNVVSFTYPEQLSRWQPLVKWLLAVPHYVVLFFLFVASVVAVVVGFFAVLITGDYPEGLRDFLVGVARWSLRVQAYVGLLTDEHPPFTLSASS